MDKLEKISIAPIIAAVVAVTISGGEFDSIDTIVGITFFLFLYPKNELVVTPQIKILYPMIFGLLFLSIFGVVIELILFKIITPVPDTYFFDNRLYNVRQISFAIFWVISSFIFSRILRLKVNNKEAKEVFDHSEDKITEDKGET